MSSDQTAGGDFLSQLRNFAKGFLDWANQEGSEGHHPPDASQHQRALGGQSSTINQPPTYPKQASGTLLMAPDRRALFLRRSGTADRGGMWSIPGGLSEGDETAWQTALRETKEEVGDINLTADDLQLLDHNVNANNGVGFTTYGAKVQDAFEPVLNHEHDDYRWATLKDAPQPLHPGLKATMDFAMDPLTAKGEKIMKAMQDFYGSEKGKQVFYASAHKGRPGLSNAWIHKGRPVWGESAEGSLDAEPPRPNTNIEQIDPSQQLTPFGATTDRFARHQLPMAQHARSSPGGDEPDQSLVTSPGQTHTDPHTWPWESATWKPPVKGDAWDSPNWSWERTQKRTYPDGSTDTATFKVSPQQPKAPAVPSPPAQKVAQPSPQPQAQSPERMISRNQQVGPPQQQTQFPQQQAVPKAPTQPAKRPMPGQMPAQTDANGIGIRNAYERGREKQAHPGGLRETYMQGIQRRHNASDQSEGLRRTGSAPAPGGGVVQTQATPQQRLQTLKMQPNVPTSTAPGPQQRLKRQNVDHRVATDPPVSEAQRKAMHAAAAGKSTIGIPQSVGKEYIKADQASQSPPRGPISFNNQLRTVKTLDNILRDALVGQPTRVLQDRVNNGWSSPQFTTRDDTLAPDLDPDRDSRPSGVMGQIERSRKVRLLPRGRLPPESAWAGSPSASKANPQSSGLQRSASLGTETRGRLPSGVNSSNE